MIFNLFQQILRAKVNCEKKQLKSDQIECFQRAPICMARDVAKHLKLGGGRGVGRFYLKFELQC
jgi:hypothetical protein